ncbi:MAG: outer membrane beta-barrel protein [Bacteroidales bacterium]|nr:outer membrane beta-barrel protein [Bacteroidales bacterium]
MKKVLMTICLLALGFGSQAQLITKDKTNGMQSYVRVGLTTMSLSGDDADDLKNKTGYSVMFGTQKEITSSDIFILYYSAEAGLKSRGYGMSEKYDDYKYEEYLFSHNIAASPVNLGLNLKISNDFLFDAHAGVYGAFDYYGKMKATEKEGSHKDSESISLGDIENYRRYDFGVNFGFGLWYQQFNFDVSFQKGFIDIIEDVNAVTNNITFSIGYKF